MTTVVIQRDADLEYRVPGTDGREASAYYTDDKADAIATAFAIHGTERVLLQFRNVIEHKT